jgi:hypothetical protein
VVAKVPYTPEGTILIDMGLLIFHQSNQSISSVKMNPPMARMMMIMATVRRTPAVCDIARIIVYTPGSSTGTRDRDNPPHQRRISIRRGL